jgi:membrane fusion protein (multidrug efflux system)
MGFSRHAGAKVKKMAEANQPDGKPDSAYRNRFSKKKIVGVGLLVFILAAAAAAYWWFFKYNRVSTEDAYARVDSTQISSRVPGTVLRVLVDNDYPVKFGQTLIELDPAVYKTSVQKAQAQLAQGEAEVQALAATVSQTEAQTSANIAGAKAALKAARDKKQATEQQLSELESQRKGTQANFTFAQKNYQRYEALYRDGAVAAERRDEARTKFRQAQAALDAIDDRISSEKASLAGIEQDINEAQAKWNSAQAQLYQNDIQRYRLASLKAQRDVYKAELDAARLNLVYCTITAPIDGFIAQKSIQVGDRVQPGLALMAVVPLHQIYVEANFKETDLTNVRVGQPAVIQADIYPDYTYYGKVVGIRAGTGAAFSLLPPENATGNWIKVVQRVPVKISLNEPPPPSRPLRVGLSLEVTVNTSNRSGKMLRTEDPGAAPNFQR